MKLLYAFLAHAAEVAQGGRFSAMGGGIHAIGTEKLPAVIPSMACVIRIKGEISDARASHAVLVRLIGPDGDELLAAPSQFEATDDQENPLGPRYLLVFEFGGLALQLEGEYKFRVSIDGDDLGGTEFCVVKK